MKKYPDHSIYKPKRLIAAAEINKESGYYAAVPDRGYKGHTFKIMYLQEFMKHKEDCEKLNYVANDSQYIPVCHCDPSYKLLEVTVKDWLKAEMFRRFKDQFGGGTYTLGYFKVCETL